jgi:hypothetical protein
LNKMNFNNGVSFTIKNIQGDRCIGSFQWPKLKRLVGSQSGYIADQNWISHCQDFCENTIWSVLGFAYLFLWIWQFDIDSFKGTSLKIIQFCQTLLFGLYQAICNIWVFSSRGQL